MPGQPGGGVPPKSAQDGILRRLKELEDEVARLRTARSGEAMTISKAPGIIVKNGAEVTVQDGGKVNLEDGSSLWILDGGAIIMQTPTGQTVFQAQRIDIPDGSGRKQQVLVFGRDDGTLAFALADLGTAPGHPHQQNWALYDRGQNIIFAEDTDSGQGMARPYLSLGPFVSNDYPSDTTSSGAFETLQSLVGFKQHPKVSMQLLGRADDVDTAGELRVIDQDGHVIGPVQTVAAGGYAYYTIGPVPLPGIHMQPISLNVQARRTAGTGTIGARGISAWGQQT